MNPSELLAGVENIFDKHAAAFDKLINESDASKQLAQAKKIVKEEV